MLDYIIVGAGQAGLTMAYYLKQHKLNFIVLDKEKEIGASWLNRWDSLSLFTPTEFNHLPGMEFPAAKGHYPNKNEVAAYFKKYQQTFQIPVHLNTLVEEITKTNKGYQIHSSKKMIESRGIIIATGPFHIPFTPLFASKINETINQTHSNYYQNTEQLEDGSVLVVGDGDSGVQILDEVSKSGRKTYFSGHTNLVSIPQVILGKTLWWWFTKTGFLSFNKHSWIGKKLMQKKQPIIGTDVKSILSRKNVIPVGRTLDANSKEIFTEKLNLKDVKNIIWATGYKPNFTWIEGLQLDKEDYPIHKRGVSNLENLYFIGLPWLYTRGSATLGGVKRDALHLMKHILKNDATME